MLKNRSFNVKMVKDIENADHECTRAHFDAHEVNNIMSHQVKHVALAAGAVLGAKTLSEIALHIAKTYIK